MQAAVYTIIISPFLVYLARTYLIDNPAIVNGVNTNWIYSYERLAHHLGIFKSLEFFADRNLNGVSITLGLFILCLFWFKRYKDPLIGRLNKLNLILFSEQFVFLIVALFDRNGTLLKIYPFRTSTLSSFFILLEITLILKYYGFPRLIKYISEKKFLLPKTGYWQRRAISAKGIRLIFLSLFFIFFSLEWYETLTGKNCDQPPVSDSMKEIIDHINRNTPREAVFLILNKDHPWGFHRMTNRERFVVWKFTPTKSDKIYEWYQRTKWRNLLEEDITRLDTFNTMYHADYVIAKNGLRHPSLRVVLSTDELSLYKNEGTRKTEPSPLPPYNP